MTHSSQPVAVITGASRGLGLVLAEALADRGWQLVVDARRTGDLTGRLPSAVVLPGDVADPVHRQAIAAATDAFGRVDLLVNNASDLGVSPLATLADYPLAELRRVYEVNVLAPVALTQLLLPALRASGGTVVNISSDAAVEPYETWGGYGPSKAALDQVSAILGVEESELRVYAIDPGDMRTDMHQAAFPGEDISDRPEPASVVPSLLQLLDEHPPSGRYRAESWASSARTVVS